MTIYGNDKQGLILKEQYFDIELMGQTAFANLMRDPNCNEKLLVIHFKVITTLKLRSTDKNKDVFSKQCKN